MRRLTELKGIGAKTEQLFAKLQIFSQEDLLRHYPRTYERFTEPVRIGEVICGSINSVEGVIRSAPSVRSFGGRTITMVYLKDETGSLQVNWFNMPYLRSSLRPGTRRVFRGLVIEKGNRRIMEHPRLYTPEDYEATSGAMLPVYPLTDGLSNNLIRKAVREALEKADAAEEYLPEDLRTRHQLAEINFALHQIHFPEREEDCAVAQRRIIFDEFFLFLLGVAFLRRAADAQASSYVMRESWKTEEIIENLPYRLTKGQCSTWSEIERDLASGHLMSRLVQGDVGSGKTILAFLAMIRAMESGTQSALMVPTEVLARQHARTFGELLEMNGIDRGRLVLLVGSMTAAQKREARERIADGSAALIIGTHALIQEGVTYDRLALVITDEQHRFGVRQRLRLTQQDAAPHVLVMSATPIPRTLAMMLYGDLDISTLRDVPARRLRVKNALVDTSYRASAYRFFQKEIEGGHQVYVVCPMVDPSDGIPAENVTDYAAMLRRKMGAGVRIGVLHGQMKSDQKNEVMTAFVAGEIDLLVSTTVIEVGVDVPNATVMMIENAERFGLAQLHQLRGRVGRGEAQSYCIFVYGGEGEMPERLKIMAESNDGFAIAEEDLRLRGPGDLFGVRQSGELLFSVADIYRDRELLTEANEAARELLALDPELALPQHAPLKTRLDIQIQHQYDEETRS